MCMAILASRLYGKNSDIRQSIAVARCCGTNASPKAYDGSWTN